MNHTKPRVSGGSFVFSKKGTACSPVTTPRFVVSAAWNNWKNTLFSSWVRFRLGGAIDRNAGLAPIHSPLAIKLEDMRQTCFRHSFFSPQEPVLVVVFISRTPPTANNHLSLKDCRMTKIEQPVFPTQVPWYQIPYTSPQIELYSQSGPACCQLRLRDCRKRAA